MMDRMLIEFNSVTMVGIKSKKFTFNFNHWIKIFFTSFFLPFKLLHHRIIAWNPNPFQLD